MAWICRPFAPEQITKEVRERAVLAQIQHADIEGFLGFAARAAIAGAAAGSGDGAGSSVFLRNRLLCLIVLQSRIVFVS